MSGWWFSEAWHSRSFWYCSLPSENARLNKQWSSICVSYLLADWAASFAVGHISSGSKDSNDPCDKKDFVTSVAHFFFSSGNAKVSSCGNDKQEVALSINSTDLLAFWVPFLLVHRGGPDTITAFALEDNELWLRHLFSLEFQLGVTLYVFWLTLLKTSYWDQHCWCLRLESSSKLSGRIPCFSQA